MKTGVTTSEFWATIAAMAVLAVLGAIDKLTPELIAAIAGPAGLYAISRGVAKHGNGG